jgi:adenosylmethionine-8-amino-7-oxononanoate aminotransferase
MGDSLRIWHPFSNRALDALPVRVERAEDAGYLSAMRPKLYAYFLERGVLLRSLGNVIYVLPPYVISAGDLHHVYDVIQEAVQTLF